MILDSGLLCIVILKYTLFSEEMYMKFVLDYNCSVGSVVYQNVIFKLHRP